MSMDERLCTYLGNEIVDRCLEECQDDPNPDSCLERCVGEGLESLPEYCRKYIMF